MKPDRLAYLQTSRAELQRRLQTLNADFARELRQLRDSIAMAHNLLEGEADLAEEQVRTLVKQMIEQHPRGRMAASLLACIENTERQLLSIEGELGEARVSER